VKNFFKKNPEFLKSSPQKEKKEFLKLDLIFEKTQKNFKTKIKFSFFEQFLRFLRKKRKS
jgi:hypothetical protein